MNGDVDWSIRAPGHRSFIATIAGCGLLLAVGIAAGLYGHSLSVFRVEFATASKAFSAWCTDGSRIDDAAGDRYLAMLTDHYAWVDAGVGLVLCSLTIASLAVALRYQSADEHWLRTPQGRLTYVVAGTGALLWFFGAIIHSFSIDAERMFFPWCADSISIPIFSIGVIAIVVIPVAILAGSAIAWLFGALPVPLDQWESASPVRSSVITLAVGAAMLGVAALLVDSLRYSTSAASPALIVGIYLLASTRAALLSPKQRDAAEDCR